MAKAAWSKIIITRSRVRVFKMSAFFKTTTALIIFLTIRGKSKLIIDVKIRHAKANTILLVYGRAYFRIFANSLIYTRNLRRVMVLKNWKVYDTPYLDILQ